MTLSKTKSCVVIRFAESYGRNSPQANSDAGCLRWRGGGVGGERFTRDNYCISVHGSNLLDMILTYRFANDDSAAECVWSRTTH